MPRVQRRLAALVDEYILDYFDRQDEFKDIVPLLKEKFKINRKFKVHGTLEEAIHQYNERASCLIQTTSNNDGNRLPVNTLPPTISELETKLSNNYAPVAAFAGVLSERIKSKSRAMSDDSFDDSLSHVSSEKETTKIKSYAGRSAAKKSAAVASSNKTSKFQATTSKTTSTGVGSIASKSTGTGKNKRKEPTINSSLSSSSDEKAALRQPAFANSVKSSATSKISVKAKTAATKAAAKVATATTKNASKIRTKVQSKQTNVSDSSLTDSAMEHASQKRAAVSRASSGSSSDSDETSTSVGKTQVLSSLKKCSDAVPNAASKSAASKRSIPVSKTRFASKNISKSSTSEFSDDDYALVSNKPIKIETKTQAPNNRKKGICEVSKTVIKSIVLAANLSLKHSSDDDRPIISTQVLPGLTKSFMTSRAMIGVESKVCGKNCSESSKVDSANLESVEHIESRGNVESVAASMPGKSQFSCADIFSKLTPRGSGRRSIAFHIPKKTPVASRCSVEYSDDSSSSLLNEDSSDTEEESAASKPGLPKLIPFVPSRRFPNSKLMGAQRKRLQSSDDDEEEDDDDGSKPTTVSSISTGEVSKTGKKDAISSEHGKSSLSLDGDTSRTDREKIAQHSFTSRILEVKSQGWNSENNVDKKSKEQSSSGKNDSPVSDCDLVSSDRSDELSVRAGKSQTNKRFKEEETIGEKDFSLKTLKLGNSQNASSSRSSSVAVAKTVIKS